MPLCNDACRTLTPVGQWGLSDDDACKLDDYVWWWCLSENACPMIVHYHCSACPMMTPVWWCNGACLICNGACQRMMLVWWWCLSNNACPMKPVQWCLYNDAWQMLMPVSCWCLSNNEDNHTMPVQWGLYNDAWQMLMPVSCWWLSTMKTIRQCLFNEACPMMPVQWCLTNVDACQLMMSLWQWRQSDNDACPIMMPDHNLQMMPNNCQKILLFLTVNKHAMTIKKYWI